MCAFCLLEKYINFHVIILSKLIVYIILVTVVIICMHKHSSELHGWLVYMEDDDMLSFF